VEFFEVVQHQRACREFAAEVPDDDVVGRVLTAATFAPSAENRQPWVFVVVRDDTRRAAIGDLARRAWEGGGRQWSEGRLTPSMLDEVDRGARGSVAAAPVLVVVAADTTLGLPATVGESVFPAVQNLLLAATALGLGSALTTLPVVGGREELAELLGLPPDVVPLAVVPLGYPARPLGPPRRRPLREKAHAERYGTPFGPPDAGRPA